MLKREYSRAARSEQRLARRRGSRDTGRMRRNLDHLPAGKRRELEFVTEALTTAFAEAISTRRAEDLATGQVLKIILFGSYARGDWVEDPVGRYFSDYDLLIVVNNDKLTDVTEFWEGAEKRLLSALSNGQHLRTPTSFIVHSLDEVNDQLTRGRYFFVDIVRDGVMLFEAPGHPFVEPQDLSPRTALMEAAEYYEDWMASAADFLRSAAHDLRDGAFKMGAFHFHQAAEHLYNCLLLVVTLYTPKAHNLVRLRNLTDPLDPRLAEVWPTATKFEKRCFEQLRAAYVKARYSRQYKITAAELDWISTRVAVLRSLVQDVCERRLATLREEAERTQRDQD